MHILQTHCDSTNQYSPKLKFSTLIKTSSQFTYAEEMIEGRGGGREIETIGQINENDCILL